MNEDGENGQDGDHGDHDGWTRYVSLMVVVLAAATTIASHKAASFQSQIVLYQAQSSDAWASYQAKSTQQRLADMEARRASGAEAARAAVEATRYRAEEKELRARAQRLEAERDAAVRHGPPLGFSVASLQIAIAIAALCLITRRRMLWAASGILGVLGVGYLLYGIYGV
jgi:hypothetical protein